MITSLDLEQRVAQALANAEALSVDLAALVDELNTAITEADATALEQREISHDPLRSPDPAKARAAMQDAEFVRDRLKSLEPRLREHHHMRVIEEEVDRWLGRRGDLLVERDHLASRLREDYPALRQQLLGLFAEIADLDARIAKLMRDRPDAAGSYSLKGVELAARGVDRFTFVFPSALEAVRLPELSVVASEAAA